MRRQKRRWTAIGIGVSYSVKVFDRPYSTALMVVLLVATSVVTSVASPKQKSGRGLALGHGGMRGRVQFRRRRVAAVLFKEVAGALNILRK
jgi:hypothetical protein